MSLSPYTVVVFSQDTGNVVPFVSVEIRERNANGSSGGYAPIYTNSTGATPITQPGATTNSRGTLQFYAEPDGYNVEYVVDGQIIIQPVDVGVTPEQVKSKVFVSKNEMQSSTLSIGDIATLTSEGNGSYAIETLSDPTDGISNIDLTGGVGAYLIDKPLMSIDSFDYATKPINDAIQSAANFSSSKSVSIYSPDGIDGSGYTGSQDSNSDFWVRGIGFIGNGSNRLPLLNFRLHQKQEQLSNGMYKTPADFNIRTGTLVYSAGLSPKLHTDIYQYAPLGFDMSIKQAVDQGLTIACLAEYGDDLNTGADFDNAKRSFSAAIGLNPDVIFTDGGHFDIADGWTNPVLTKDLSVININPIEKTLFTSRRKTTWTDNGNGTHTSSTLGGTPISLYDKRHKDEYGDFAAFTKYADNDTASVIADPFSWCRIGSGSSSQAVANFNGMTPNDYYSWVQRSTNRNLDFNAAGHKFYAKGIHWAMGDNSGLTPNNGTNDSVFIAEDCLFTNAFQNDGLRVQGVGLSISINCRCSANEKDGFNYHQGTNTSAQLIQTHAIEIDCVGINHFQTAGTANGTTAHEDTRVFRINGQYGFGVGPSIVDIDTTKTYMVNCSGSAGIGDPNASGILFSDGTVEAWLHNCHASRGETADLRVSSSCIAHVCGGLYGSMKKESLGDIDVFYADIV